jgi:serine/threonine-protein kinase
MSNLARELIMGWGEDEATLLYDAPSRSSAQQSLAPTLGTRAGSGPFSQVQLIVTVVAAMIGAMVAARTIVERTAHASLEPAPAPDKPSAKAAEAVRASAPPAQPPAQPESKPLPPSQPSQRAKAAAAAAQDRRAEIAARPRTPARAQSRSAPALREAQSAAPRPAAPAQAASNRKGTLRINSRPWSKVYVDGRAIGNTPQMAIAVAPGTHKVKLVNKEFELERTLNIEVRAGQTVSRSIEMMQ